jgi:hypothetical protein
MTSVKERFLFGKGWIHEPGRIYLCGAPESANERDEWLTAGIRWLNGSWGLWPVETRAISICTIIEQGERVVICAGNDGHVDVSDVDGAHVETIDPSDDGPNRLRHITAVRPVGNELIAVGMQRMAYRRDLGSKRWLSFDEGMRVPRSSPEITGLKDCDGSSGGNLLAVGFYGEIWRFAESKWTRLDSPIKVKLTSVRCVDGQTAYVAAGAGILRVEGNSPALFAALDEAYATIRSLEWYRNELYAATNSGIFRLRNRRFEPVELGHNHPVTTGWLHSNADMLLSVGERDVWLFDGQAWQELRMPGHDSDWPFT